MGLGRLRLGVNVDHVATVREARGTPYPDPVEAALLAERSGADGITAHLREDRRHIQDRDVRRLQALIATKLNLEMAATEEMVRIALDVGPRDVCLVPERREELTTEGGLDVRAQESSITGIVERLRSGGIEVSLFVDPDAAQLEAAVRTRARVVELHTGAYAEANDADRPRELERIDRAARRAKALGLRVNAGHGLHADNVAPIARLPELEELNIGHSIVARAVLIGMEEAVGEIRRAIDGARDSR